MTSASEKKTSAEVRKDQKKNKKRHSIGREAKARDKNKIRRSSHQHVTSHRFATHPTPRAPTKYVQTQCNNTSIHPGQNESNGGSQLTPDLSYIIKHRARSPLTANHQASAVQTLRPPARSSCRGSATSPPTSNGQPQHRKEQTETREAV